MSVGGNMEFVRKSVLKYDQKPPQREGEKKNKERPETHHVFRTQSKFHRERLTTGRGKQTSPVQVHVIEKKKEGGVFQRRLCGPTTKLLTITLKKKKVRLVSSVPSLLETEKKRKKTTGKEHKTEAAVEEHQGKPQHFFFGAKKGDPTKNVSGVS